MKNHPTINHPPAPTTEAMDDEKILRNIDGRMHGPMNGLINKYFGDFQHVQDALLETQAAGSVSGRCTVPSAAPSPETFLQWFSGYVSRELDSSRNSWHISTGNGAPEQESADEGARLLLALPSSPTSDVQTSWGHVQVVGQFYRGDVRYQDGLLGLCRSAYQVFASQPTRLFLHAFYIRGSLIELWVFDRSGLYCSDVFDIRKDFTQFLSVIRRNQLMTDQDLGRLNMIQTDEGGSYIILPSLGKLSLESQPIASQDGLIGTGVTCYRAKIRDSKRWDYIVEFKWRWAREHPEDELLKLAKEKCAWGAISLDYYKELESTANLRRSLRWGKQRRFAKMDSPERHAGVEGQGQQTNAGGLADCTEETNDFFQNRVLACIVTSPVGRSLDTFQSLTELLQVFRDAIKCHRSLYQDAKILHQDISPGNMIILDGQDEGEPKGILIDLDCAVELAEEPEEDSRIVGTRPFMAIGVLKREHHTYRHDLESFLYVFLWMVITNHADDPPETSRLRLWRRGGWDELAVRKSLDVDQHAFREILDEFTPEFHSLKPLAERLRRILFPLRDGAIWTGTHGPEAVDGLYDGIIGAFEEAISSEGGRWTHRC
ncbi:hypothetical protein ACJZ2D_003041 [Fusarium nematophilum]